METILYHLITASERCIKGIYLASCLNYIGRQTRAPEIGPEIDYKIRGLIL